MAPIYSSISGRAISQARQGFAGAKLLLFIGEAMPILRRDHSPGIPWPGRLDFPGGGREAGETPEACALRETQEELGLCVPRSALRYVTRHRGAQGLAWFFAAHLPAARATDLRFGGEGAGWQMMAPQAYCAAPLAIPHFAAILRFYLHQQGLPTGMRAGDMGR